MSCTSGFSAAAGSAPGAARRRRGLRPRRHHLLSPSPAWRRVHGLTLSPTQRAHAEREAKRRGVADACRFHLRSYDDDLPAPGAGGRRSRSSRSNRSLIRPNRRAASPTWPGRFARGGRLMVVDDVPDERLALGRRRLRRLSRRVALSGRSAATPRFSPRCPAPASPIDADDDLTGAGPFARSSDALERLVKSNRRWRTWAGWTGAAELIDSLYGGLMLERLYRRGLMQYRLVAARRTAASG